VHPGRNEISIRGENGLVVKAVDDRDAAACTPPLTPATRVTFELVDRRAVRVRRA
jgi:hypothetical protein